MIKIKNPDRHVWEGWTVRAFIKDIEMFFDAKGTRYWADKSRNDIKKWCMSEQPHYKKYIPEVVDYFYEKSKLNRQ